MPKKSDQQILFDLVPTDGATIGNGALRPLSWTERRYLLSERDLELAILEQRRDETRSIKQGMMQQLLTGQTRLV